MDDDDHRSELSNSLDTYPDREPRLAEYDWTPSPTIRRAPPTLVDLERAMAVLAVLTPRLH